MHEPYLFRVLRADMPDFLRGWRPLHAATRWDRHYLVAPGHSLVVTGGALVELTRAGAADGFRIEQTLLSAAFPLDWMSLRLIGAALPRRFAGAELDGRDPQRFVDSLAFPGLTQVSAAKEVFVAAAGQITVTASAIRVPDWDACAVTLEFESFSAAALRAFLSAAGVGDTPHREIDDWLRDARAAAFAGLDARAA